MGTENMQRYLEFHSGSDDAKNMKLVDAAKYLGVLIGPSAPRTQWEAVAVKTMRRMPDVLAAPSLTGRVCRFNTYIASLFQYKAQFIDPDPTTVRLYRHAGQTLTNATWMAFPPDLLENMKGLGYPLEVCKLPMMARQMQVGVLVRSAVWQDVVYRIDVASMSDEARRNPHCSWHVSSIISNLRATHVWLTALPRELRDEAHHGSARRFLEKLRGGDAGRRDALLPTLTRRAHRWFDRADDAVRGLQRFLADSPSCELSTAVLKTWLYAWCTSSRFNRPVEPCRMCGSHEGDRQAHYCRATSHGDGCRTGSA